MILMCPVPFALLDPYLAGLLAHALALWQDPASSRTRGPGDGESIQPYATTAVCIIMLVPALGRKWGSEWEGGGITPSPSVLQG